MLIGDSITKGQGTLTYRRQLWQGLVAQGCSVDFVGPTADPSGQTSFDADNAAIWGVRADVIADVHVAGWANAARPDVVVIALGTNDSNQNQSAASTLADLAKIISSVRTVNPTVKVVLAAPYDMNGSVNPLFVTGNARLAELRPLMGPFATDQSTPGSPVTLVDLSPVVTTADLYDGIHPSETGDAKVAAALRPTVAGFIGCAPDSVQPLRTPRPAARTAGRPLQATADSTTALRLTGVAGIPTGASTAVLSVTAVAPADDGWIQVGPTPVTPGTFSSLNVATGADRANLVVTPIGADGTVELYTSVTADLVVDVVGYFTGDSAPLSSTGLFVPAAPQRWFDSRRTGIGSPTIGLDLATLAPAMSAVVTNVTTTNGAAGVWVQVGPAPLTPGAHSNLNVAETGHDIAVSAITAVGAARLVEVHRSGPTDVVVDIVGWFT